MKLDKMRIGQRGRVSKVACKNKGLRRRLLDMGITKNASVEMKKIAPLGDPIDIKVRGYELCLRKRDMCMVEVEVDEDENCTCRKSKQW